MYATTTDWSFEEWTDEHQKLLEEKYYISKNFDHN